MREVITKKSTSKAKKEVNLEDLRKELTNDLFSTTIKTNISEDTTSIFTIKFFSIGIF